MKKNKIPKTITIHPDVWEKLTRISENTGFTRSNLIETSLKTLFENELLEDEGIRLRLDRHKYV